MDEIKFKKLLRPINKSYLFDSKPNNNLNSNINNISTFINKPRKYYSKDIKKLCKAFINNKHMKIINLKKMTPRIKRLRKIYANL